MAKTLDDIITEPNILGRIGGEEFLAVIINEEGEDMSAYCDKLQDAICSNTVEYEDHKIKITSSGGVANSAESENASDLINKADERLYDAKKAGRNKFILD
jgi:diguanylate cyclase (GGDEF)-like protein